MRTLGFALLFALAAGVGCGKLGEETAPAKLTLELRRTGVRDDGYHLIDAEMGTLAVHDTLTIEHAANTDRLDLFLFANPATGQMRLVAALDNLGKGAAGAAVQTVNLMAGLPETAGLRV